jgi:aspartokinase-like uncharacterized kinase
MSIDKTEHNGWTNYATWRVNLEMFDAPDYSWDITSDTDAHELAQRLKDSVICFVDETCELATTRGWAIAFVDEVNFYEIAKHMIGANELYCEIGKKVTENHKEKA